MIHSENDLNIIIKTLENIYGKYPENKNREYLLALDLVEVLSQNKILNDKLQKIVRACEFFGKLI